MLRINVIFGGRSIEHYVSCNEYENLRYCLNNNYSEDIYIENVLYIKPECNISVFPANGALLPSMDTILKSDYDREITVLPLILSKNELFTFSLLQGQMGEDGAIQGIADVFNLYGNFGSVVTTSAGFNKHVQAALAAQFGGRHLNEIKSTLVKAEEWEFSLESLKKLHLGEKVILKPNSAGSSFHTYAIEKLTEHDIAEYAEMIRAYDDFFLVQEKIEGADVSVGLLERDGVYDVLPIMEVELDDSFFNFESKKTKTGFSLKSFKNKLVEEKLKDIVQRLSWLHVRQGYCRYDFIVDDAQEIYFLEVNTRPGLTKGSLFPEMLEKAGLTLIDLIKIEASNAARHRPILAERQNAIAELAAAA